MSPMLGYGTTGHATNAPSTTPDAPTAGTEGGLGFVVDSAARGAHDWGAC